jgi:uncharacterized protein YraI
MSPKLFRFIGLAGILLLAMLFMAPTETEAADSTWFAQYFNNTSLSGGPVLSRQEQELNHSWGTKNDTLPGVNKDNFSARWTRRVHFPTTGTYRFSGTMDDGMRVWVDGALVIDAWTTGSERTITGDRYITAGEQDVKVEFFEAVLFATARVSWQLTSSTNPPPTTITNWRGEYYNNKDLSGSPALIRDDAAINFNWNQGTPAPGIISTDNFSVRWTRNINFNAGRYSFTAATDDGVRLWVNNALIIDNWRTQPLTTKTAEIELPTGSVPVRMEYFDATGGANAVLSWSQVGVNTPNWRGEYFNNNSLVGGPAVIRDDANINFNWGDGSPAAGISNDNFSVRWTRSLVLNPGRHRFTTRTDDGVRLWVNNQLIIDSWHAMSPTTIDAEVELFGGPASIKMEYFDLTGGAQASLNITQITTPPTGGPGSGQGGVGTATVRSTLLNVRQGPAISFPIITTITRGTVVQLGGYRNASTTWVMVILSNGQQGWSYAPFLQTTYNLTTLQVWSDPGSGNGGTPNTGPTATVYGAYYLNVRSGPGTTYAPFMTLARGTVVTLIGRNSSGGWLKIQTAGGTQGWSSASYLQTNYNISDLLVLTN